MKRLKTDIDGGFPFVLDDIRFMYESLSEATRALLSPFGDSTKAVILSGLELSLSLPNVTITDGVVAWNGDVYNVTGTTAPFIPNHIYFVPVSTFDPAGLKTFQLTGSHDTYEYKSLEIVISNTPPAGYLFEMNDVIANYWQSTYNKMQEHLIPTTTIKTQTISPLDILPGTYNVYASVDFSKNVHLSGRRWCDDVSAGSLLFTIDDDWFRPSQEQVLIVPLTTSNKAAIVKITVPGDVIFVNWLDGVGGVSTFVLSLDNIVYQQY